MTQQKIESRMLYGPDNSRVPKGIRTYSATVQWCKTISNDADKHGMIDALAVAVILPLPSCHHMAAHLVGFVPWGYSKDTALSQIYCSSVLTTRWTGPSACAAAAAAASCWAFASCFCFCLRLRRILLMWAFLPVCVAAVFLAWPCASFCCRCRLSSCSATQQWSGSGQ